MFISKSFDDQDKPLVYLVATPIGNLDDISVRQLAILKSVDFVLSEDTRNTSKLLNHFGINQHLISYHEHNKAARTTFIMEELKKGKKIALVSDAGNPVISDPGFELVQELIKNEYSVVPVPGISAYTTALIASGISPKPHTYYGFLDHKKSKRIKELTSLKNLDHTIIFYESIHRLKDSLNDIYEVLGERKCVVGRELTKLHEEFIYGFLSELVDYEFTLKGEIVIVVEKSMVVEQNEMDPIKEIDFLIENGATSKEAIKKVAKLLDIKTSELYESYHKLK